MLKEVGAVHVVAVAQEDVEPEPLVDPEVSGEALSADRVPRHVGPAHALGVRAQVRLRCRRCHGEGDVASVQEAELGDAVGERRAADAPGFGPAADALLEVEPVEDQLGATVKQLRQRSPAVRALEEVVVRDPYHRHALPRGGKLVHGRGDGHFALGHGCEGLVPFGLADDRRMSERH